MPKIKFGVFEGKLQALADLVGNDEAIVFLKISKWKVNLDRVAFEDRADISDAEESEPLEKCLNLRKTLSYLG